MQSFCVSQPAAAQGSASEGAMLKSSPVPAATTCSAPCSTALKVSLVAGLGLALLGFLGLAEPSPALLLAGRGSSKRSSSPAPLLGDGTEVDWWFAFKPTTDAFPQCSTKLTCMFGGDTQQYSGWGLQYILSYGSKGQTQTSAMKLHSDCLGNGEDPVGKTFEQVYSGGAANYVVWNDQFYSDPELQIKPACFKYCAGPWGHSKGVMAWGEDGTGFVMQVTTPDWPGSGSASKPRKSQGNTLGCCHDDNVKVAQHFFALRLGTAGDTRTVLEALGRASAATDPSNPQLVKLTRGPEDLAGLAKGLGKQVLDNLTPILTTLSVGGSGQVRLIAKPSGLQVPPWHMVSSLLQAPLRTASWWAKPEINSTKSGFLPGCWSKELKAPEEVQVALSGQWEGKTFSLQGHPSTNGNHAKLGHSLSGPKLAVMADMNQQGTLSGDGSGPDNCQISQNGRGGLFFVVEDAVLHAGLTELLTGTTAQYVGPGPGPSPPPPPPPPGPPGHCGGAGVVWQACQQSGCTYVHAADVKACGVPHFGCYTSTKLPAGCPKASAPELLA